MRHIELTPEIEAKVREKLLARDEVKNAYNTYTVKVLASGEIEASNDGCAAYLAQCWTGGGNDNYGDIVGVAYGGYGESKQEYGYLRGYGEKALKYLTALMTVKAYSGLHPYLVDTDPEKILEAKGFIFHNTTDPAFNMGLFFTFMVASRQCYENRRQMNVFLEASQKYPPDIALLCAHLLIPSTVPNQWVRKTGTHGDPFGAWPARLFPKRFLSGDTRHIAEITTRSAQGVFTDENWSYPGYNEMAVENRASQKTLEQWVESFEKERMPDEASIAA